MTMRLLGFLSILVATCWAQVNDGDYVLTENDTNVGVTVHNVYSINRISGAVTTLYTVPPSTTVLPNWITMARDNLRMMVAYSNVSTVAVPYGLTYLDRTGALTSTLTTNWSAHNVRVRDNGQLIWNSIVGGGGPPVTNTVTATNDAAGALTTLVPGLPATATPVNGCEIEDTGLFAVNAQTNPPAGYLSIVNLSGTIVTTYSGFGLFNTTDFNRRNGLVYGTEFGLPGNAAAFGGTLWSVSPGGTITSIAGGLSYDRMNTVEVMQNGQLLVGSRHNLFEMDTAGNILRTLPWQVDRLHAVTGATVYGSNRLQLDTSGGTAPGNTVNMKVAIRNPAFNGGTYILAPCLSMRPGVQLPGGDYVDLNTGDALFLAYFIFGAGNGTIFRNLTGALNGSGESPSGASGPQIVIPADLPPGTGVRLIVSGLALGSGGALAGIEGEGFTLN